mgnify:CR=1 FL=1
MRTSFLFILCIFLCSFSIKAQDTLVIVGNIQLLGNKVTKDKIMLREITFRPGDTLGKQLLAQKIKSSKDNLMNTSLFNFVETSDSIVSVEGIKKVEVTFDVIERWYIWPLPIFELAERNFNAWLQTKDLSQINYGMFLDWKNFRGRRETLKILLQFGYDEKIGFSYGIPYIDKKQTIGLDFGFSQTKNHQVSYATIDNQVERVRLEAYARRAYSAFVAIGHRPDIYQSHYFEASYYDHIYDDTIFQINPEFYKGEGHRPQYLKLSYAFKNDHRDFKPFPLKGYYFDFLLEQTGLGFFHRSDINILSAKVNARKYWTFSRRFFFAGGVTGRIANNNSNPYFLNQGVGYGRDFVRGYEFYVVDGQNYGILKTDFKFAIVPQQVTTLKFIPIQSFNKIPWAIYLSLFGDAGYVPGEALNGNDLQNSLLIGYGAGLNLVTYYDIVFRLEYSFNHKGERGFFIHFMASI